MDEVEREPNERIREMAEEIRRVGARARKARDEQVKGIEDEGIRESLFKALKRP